MSNMSGPWRCEREGFAARSSGETRETNPYHLLLGADVRPWLKKVQRDMTTAWWRGWDKAHGQLESNGLSAGHDGAVATR